MSFSFQAICHECNFKLVGFTQKQIINYVRNHKKECKTQDNLTVKKVKNKYGMWVAE